MTAILPPRLNRWSKPPLLGQFADGGDPLEAAAVEGLEGDADGADPPAVDDGDVVRPDGAYHVLEPQAAHAVVDNRGDDCRVPASASPFWWIVRLSIATCLASMPPMPWWILVVMTAAYVRAIVTMK